MKRIADLPQYRREKWKKYWGWSVTRQNLWDTCPQSYYYRYIYGWVHPMEKNKIDELKDLQTVPLAHGIHISEALNGVLNNRLSADIESAKNFFRKKMNKTFEEGEKKLTELKNGLHLPEKYLESHIISGEKEIEYFMKDIYPSIKDMKMIFVDARDKYTIEDKIFYSAPDFLGVDEEGLWHLIDWKSGSGEKTEEKFLKAQLIAYALHAVKLKKADPNRIKMYVVFLQVPSKNVEISLTDKILEDGKKTLFEMHDNLLEKSINGPFSPVPEETKCRFCNFATICSEGMQFLQR